MARRNGGLYLVVLFFFLLLLSAFCFYVPALCIVVSFCYVCRSSSTALFVLCNQIICKNKFCARLILIYVKKLCDMHKNMSNYLSVYANSSIFATSKQNNRY